MPTAPVSKYEKGYRFTLGNGYKEDIRKRLVDEIITGKFQVVVFGELKLSDIEPAQVRKHKLKVGMITPFTRLRIVEG